MISLSALRANCAVARAHARNAGVWVVIKANGYGHGLLRVARALADVADGFAVLDFHEAVLLRDAGMRQPILLLEGFFALDDIGFLGEYGLTAVVHCAEQVEMLARVKSPVKLPVYLKFNSGMNRLGLPRHEFDAAFAGLQALDHVGEITLMTHFASADLEEGIAEPFARFETLRQGYANRASAANSATLLRYPEARADWVRPGIMLYGGSPFPSRASAESLGLKPVMTLASEVIAVQHVQRGDRIGYGGLFVADRTMRVGIVACGYADGYPRHAPTGTPILVGGRRTRTLGRVSMDMLAADLTDLPETGVGSPVVLWGNGLPADDVAAAAGTISYELFCALAARVPVEEAW